MNSNQLIRVVTSLKMPLDQFVLFGGCCLAIRNLRPTDDLDLFVTEELYSNLKTRFGGEVHRYGQRYLVFEHQGIAVDAHAEWHMIGWQPDFASYLKEPEMVKGLPFMPLRAIYEWKADTAREKDLADCHLIEAYWQKIKVPA